MFQMNILHKPPTSSPRKLVLRETFLQFEVVLNEGSSQRIRIPPPHTPNYPNSSHYLIPWLSTLISHLPTHPHSPNTTNANLLHLPHCLLKEGMRITDKCKICFWIFAKSEKRISRKSREFGLYNLRYWAFLCILLRCLCDNQLK